MKRVFVYCRVSTASQVSGDGFDRQEAACRAFADYKGWHIARVFRESQSGSDEWANRKLLSEAMELAGVTTDINTILVERSDRIARDLVVGELFLRDCRERGIQVFAADSQQDLVNSEGEPTRTLIRQILGSLAQWERSVICRKLQAGRRATAERTGKPCGGVPPMPYGDRGGVAQKNAERLVLRQILKLRREGMPYLEIARHLQNARIKNPNPFYSQGAKNNICFWGEATIRLLVKIWMDRPEVNAEKREVYDTNQR